MFFYVIIFLLGGLCNAYAQSCVIEEKTPQQICQCFLQSPFNVREHHASIFHYSILNDVPVMVPFKKTSEVIRFKLKLRTFLDFYPTLKIKFKNHILPVVPANRAIDQSESCSEKLVETKAYLIYPEDKLSYLSEFSEGDSESDKNSEDLVMDVRSYIDRPHKMLIALDQSASILQRHINGKRMEFFLLHALLKTLWQLPEQSLIQLAATDLSKDFLYQMDFIPARNLWRELKENWLIYQTSEEFESMKRFTYFSNLAYDEKSKDEVSQLGSIEEELETTKRAIHHLPPDQVMIYLPEMWKSKVVIPKERNSDEGFRYLLKKVRDVSVAVFITDGLFDRVIAEEKEEVEKFPVTIQFKPIRAKNAPNLGQEYFKIVPRETDIQLTPWVSD